MNRTATRTGAGMRKAAARGFAAEAYASPRARHPSHLVGPTHTGCPPARATVAPDGNPVLESTTRLTRPKSRIALPSKGRMAEDTLDLLKSCQLNVKKPNPRQYVAKIPELPELEVWFQRASDIVRRLGAGDVDLGILGYDMFHEFSSQIDKGDLIVVHDELDFGHCHLALGVPSLGEYADVHSIDDLKAMGWRAGAGDPSKLGGRPLRVVTGYRDTAEKFFESKGLGDGQVEILAADGALEAAPYMGCADIILDLVSTGTTLRENNLKEIAGGRVIESQGILVASKKSLRERSGLLEVVREMLERIEAHLAAQNFFSVTANMRAESEADIAQSMIAAGLCGLQGPTVAPVFSSTLRSQGLYAATVVVRKTQLHSTIRQIRKLGGSGVFVCELAYIFDDEPWRWNELQKKLAEP